MKMYLIRVAPEGTKRLAGPFTSRDDAVARLMTYRRDNPDFVGKLDVETVFTKVELAEARRQRRQDLAEGRREAVPDWFPTMKDHYAAVSHDYGIAYFPTHVAMVDGTATHLPASRYLMRHWPLMRSEEVSALSQRLLAWRQGFSAVEITGDQHVIWEAYARSGIGSCMCFDYPLEKHACQVYGGESDLHIAIARNKHGNIIARAIVNTKNKRFYSSYTLLEAGREHLLAGLRAAGYTKDPAAFVGARINLVPYDEQSDVYYMPYVDGAVSYCTSGGILEGEWKPGEWTLWTGSTSGYSSRRAC